MITETRNDIDLLVRTAIEAARAACEAILHVYRSADFGVETKGDGSPLTRADKAACAAIRQMLAPTGLPLLSEEGPRIAFSERKHWPQFWLVDPLDGTKEFIRRNGEFTVNIALVQAGKPVAGVVYAPVSDTLYYGSAKGGAWKVERGIESPLPQRRAQSLPALQQKKGVVVVASRSHLNEATERFVQACNEAVLLSVGSSLKLLLLAEGRADIYPRLAPTMEWDTAAAHAVLNAAGGLVCRQGTTEELTYNKEELVNPPFIAY